jgi:site-specific recombinase XerD
MKPTEHPLQQALETRVRWLETTLQPSTMHHYRHTVRLFLEYLQENFPEVRKPSQLRRDPHLLGWLEYLWKLRTPTGSPLTSCTRGQHVLRLRTLLELLADWPQPPRPGLLRGQDVPPRQYRLPRPLSPEDDARLQQHWAAATDLLSSALLLQRLTGMRIGECVDLAPDGLRHLGDNRWSLHVPHGKPRSERWVPVDDRVRVAIERLTFLRTLPPGADAQFLLPRPHGRNALLLALRKTLRHAAEQVGIQARIVPHQLRHSYATSMVRAGVSLPALMKLLGHHNANMTLLYVEVTQQDLQREYQAARLQPRHLMPVPPTLLCDTAPAAAADAPAVDAAIHAALRLMDLYRQLLAPSSANKQILLLSRRLTRIRSLFEKLSHGPAGEK